MAERKHFSKALLLGTMVFLASTAAQASFDSLGSTPTEEQIAAWSIDIFPDGKGLPPGHGTITRGEQVYRSKCMSCHGDNLQGAYGPALMGGSGSLASEKPLKTIGSYWPYATTVFDYIRRAMPFQAPQSLTNEEVYSVTAYLLRKNGVLPADATLDANTLKAVRMPNRDGFYVDDRPDVKVSRCMTSCLSPTKASLNRGR
ncbi:c-type cytochrome [Caballeronia cordobensis]|uniref:c-type cytochrome n=1 Tax=Caballeronia cordobensis TaxID=1353886 RepID=UPI00045EF8D2|nr:putative membrane protein [Burkholderia sp. RPE67]